MILKLLLNSQMIWMIFIKTLKNITPPPPSPHPKKSKILSFFDDKIADIISKKKLKDKIIKQ